MGISAYYFSDEDDFSCNNTYENLQEKRAISYYQNCHRKFSSSHNSKPRLAVYNANKARRTSPRRKHK